MSDKEPEKITVDLLLLLVEKLTPDEQEALRAALNDRSWRSRLKQFVPEDITKNSAKAWQHLVERLESGDIDEDIAAASGRLWQYVSDRFKTITTTDEEIEGSRTPESDLEVELELAYEELQTKIFPIRQALAQAIASETHLEKLIDKNRMQRDTALDQAAIAKERGYDEAARQATRRAERYGKALIALENELGQQCQRTISYRQRLNELEGSIDDAKSRKEILIARQRAERAASATEEVISRATTADLLSIISRLEQEYADLQNNASQTSASGTATSTAPSLSGDDTKTLLHRILTVLDRANTLMEKLDKKLPDSNADDSQDAHPGSA